MKNMSSDEKIKHKSIGEFLVGNRGLVGFETPESSAFQVVREIIENSIPYYEPILIRKNGILSVVQIGEFVEKYLGSTETYKKFSYLDIEVFTLDKDMHFAFKPITAIFKHKVESNEKLYKIHTNYKDRNIICTAGHNVFVLRDDVVKCVSTENLNSNDYICVPSRHDGFTVEKIDSIDLIDKMLKMPEEKTERIAIYGIAKLYGKRPYGNSLAKISEKLQVGMIITRQQLIDWGCTKKETDGLMVNLVKKHVLRRITFHERLCKGYMSKYVVEKNIKSERIVYGQEKGFKRDWVRFDYIPFNYYRNHRIQIPLGTKVGMLSSGYKISSIFNITNELCRFLGFYTAEGCLNKYRVFLSFGTHEQQYIEEVVRQIRNIFNCVPEIRRVHKTATNIVIDSGIVSFLMKEILKCGDKSGNKRIPWVVLNTCKDMMSDYLDTLILGDGHKLEKTMSICTASRMLVNDLKFLLTLIGKPFNFMGYVPKCDCTINGNTCTYRESWSLSMPRYDGMAKHYNNTPITYFNRMHNPVYHSHVDLLKFVNIEPINNYDGFVYDICVQDVERFIGGGGLFLIHNSLDAVEIIKKLPDIILTIKKTNGYYEIICKDNGIGLHDADIPKAFGSVLTSSKYNNRQDRGLFGLGIKVVLLHAQTTTNQPFTVITSRYSLSGKVRKISVYEMKIDIDTNLPIVTKHKTEPNLKRWHGLELKFMIGNMDFDKALPDIKKYLSLTHVICPSASIIFKYEDNVIKFDRKIDVPSEPPTEARFHPHDVDIMYLESMVKEFPDTTIVDFLMDNFQGVGITTATNFCHSVSIDVRTMMKNFDHDQIYKLNNEMTKFENWRPPSTNNLSIIGEEYFKAGVIDFSSVAFFAYAPREDVFGGTPFAIEVCCVIPEEKPKNEEKENIEVHRIVNKIPLIEDYKSCLLRKIFDYVDFNYYNVDTSQNKLIFYVHLCSSSKRVLFKDLRKGVIADIPEVKKVLDLTIKDVLRKVSAFLSNRHKIEFDLKRTNVFERYIPVLSRDLTILSQNNEENVKKILEDILVHKETA
jgi:DNA topoisomerase-6 subunit B